jgi:hypothetical protein
MSRSGYTEDCGDDWALIRWRGAVNSAIKGRRGQALLREMLSALNAMSVKQLHAHELVRHPPAFIPPETQTQVCALGCVAQTRGMIVDKVDLDDSDAVARVFGIAPALAREIVWINDERLPRWLESPEERWRVVRKWVEEHIAKEEGNAR